MRSEYVQNLGNHVKIDNTMKYAVVNSILENLHSSKKYYPDNPNTVNCLDANIEANILANY